MANPKGQLKSAHFEIDKARARLDLACRRVAAVLDAGERDPIWSESQELEESALALGRLLNK